MAVAATNIPKASSENTPIAEVMMKNHSASPAVIASALNLDEDNSMLNRINECYETGLSKGSHTNQPN